MKRRAPLRAKTQLRNKTPLQRKTQLRNSTIPYGGARPVPTPGRAPSTLPKVSKKRVVVDRAYYAAKKVYLAEHPICERCSAAPSVDLHHRANRSASTAALLDLHNFVALCRTCHDWVGLNRDAAIAEGFRQAGWDYRQRGAA